MIGELFINGKDAYTEWGLSLDSASLSALMTPAANKALIENSSRKEHGKRVITYDPDALEDANQELYTPKLADRNLTLPINFSAKTRDLFFARYASFCEELAKGTLDIRTRHQPTVMYRTIYISCSQFTEFMGGIGKYMLKLNEPNPANRSIE